MPGACLSGAWATQPGARGAYIIRRHEWGDIWIEGSRSCWQAGSTHEEFAAGPVLNTGMPPFILHTLILLVPTEALNPLGSA